MSLSSGSSRLLRSTIAALWLVSALQACGRSDPADYLYDSSDTTPDGEGAASGARPGGKGGTSFGGQSSVAGRGNGTAGTVQVGGATAAGGATSGGASRGGSGTGGSNEGGEASGGTHTSGGAHPSGGTHASGGASPVAGAGGSGSAGAPSRGVNCGADVCTDAQFCCAGLGGLACLANGNACSGAALDCTGSSDCPGSEVCCLALVAPPGSASECRASCNGPGPGRDGQLCTSTDDCPNNRPNCVGTVFGVSICTRR